MLPLLAPWIGLLLLLLLPANRRAQAWWVLVPLAFLSGLEVVLRPAFSSLPEEALTPLGLTFTSLAFGLAALWLLAKCLSGLSRVAVFFLMLVIVGGGALVAFAFRNDWEGGGPMSLVFLALPAIGALVLSLSLTLSALVCRRTYRPLRFLLGVSLFVLAGWLVVAAPVLIPLTIVSVVSGNDLELAAPLAAAAVLALLTLAVIFPFLSLAFLEPHFRNRLTMLLHLPPRSPPAQTDGPLPPIAPPPLPS